MTNKLAYEELGSSCCGAKVRDPGGTGEGICSECKEHCTQHIVKEVDLAVLNFTGIDGIGVYIHRIEYDTNSTEYNDVSECVDIFLIKEYGSIEGLEYMFDEINPIKVLDYRDIKKLQELYNTNEEEFAKFCLDREDFVCRNLDEAKELLMENSPIGDGENVAREQGYLSGVADCIHILKTNK